MITHEELKNCAALAREARNLEEYLSELRSLAEIGGIKSEMTNGLGAPLTDGTGEGGARLADIMDAMRDKARKYIEHVGYLEEAISEIDSPTHRDILRLRYVRGMTWEEISDKTHYTDRWCRKLEEVALRMLGIHSEHGAPDKSSF